MIGYFLLQDNPSPAVIIGNCLTVLVTPSVVLNDSSPIKTTKINLDLPQETKRHISPLYPRKLKPEALNERRQCLNHRFASPRLLHLSPCRANRPPSRNSLTSRLSSSHNSLVTQFQADDSSFITQAISHDTLSAKTCDITDMYNVPFDSDIYAVPIDMVRPSHATLRNKGKKPPRTKKRAKSTQQSTCSIIVPDKTHKPKEINRHKDVKSKKNSLPSSSFKKNIVDSDTDSLHLTLREMRKYLHTLYSSSSDSECKATIKKNNTIVSCVGIQTRQANKDNTVSFLKESNDLKSLETNNNHKKSSKNSFGLNAKNKKHKENIPKDSAEGEKTEKAAKKINQKAKMSPVRILSMNLKQSFCNLFRWRRQPGGDSLAEVSATDGGLKGSPPPAVRRALPPLPQSPQTSQAARRTEEETVTDFATSIQKVKDVSIHIHRVKKIKIQAKLNLSIFTT